MSTSTYTVSMNGKDIEHAISNLTIDIVNGIYAAADEMGEKTADCILDAALFKDFTGATKHSIKFVKVGEGQGFVEMLGSGILLGTMRNHGVYMRQDRPELLAWGLQAQSDKIQRAAQAVASGKRKRALIFVHRYPFIEVGVSRAETQYPAIIERNIISRLH